MKNLTMQRYIIAAMALGVSGVALADNDAIRCRPERLDGMYVFSATGYTIDPVSGALPKAIVELIRFNGDGTLTVVGSTRSINGVILHSAPNDFGTYAIGDNCVGTLAFDHGPSFDLFASPKGEDLWMIQTNPNNVFQGNVTRVSR